MQARSWRGKGNKVQVPQGRGRLFPHAAHHHHHRHRAVNALFASFGKARVRWLVPTAQSNRVVAATTHSTNQGGEHHAPTCQAKEFLPAAHGTCYDFGKDPLAPVSACTLSTRVSKRRGTVASAANTSAAVASTGVARGRSPHGEACGWVEQCHPRPGHLEHATEEQSSVSNNKTPSTKPSLAHLWARMRLSPPPCT